jgi:hypothetical protein
MAQGGLAAPAGDTNRDAPDFVAKHRHRGPSRTGATARSTFGHHTIFGAPHATALKGNAATVREKFCSCRDLLLRCPAETREHRRSPDWVRKGWLQIQAY